MTSVQNRLSPYFREALETGVVRYCAEHGLGFLAYSPTGGGRLTKRLPDHPVLAPMARELGVSAHALVIAWAMAQADCVIPIPSARTPAHAVGQRPGRRPHPERRGTSPPSPPRHSTGPSRSP